MGVGTAQRGEVEFRIVDGFEGFQGRGPIEARGSAAAGVLFELAQLGQASMRRAHDFERIERRHARARFHGVHAGVGKDKTRAGCGAGDVQTAAFVGHAVVLDAQESGDTG